MSNTTPKHKKKDPYAYPYFLNIKTPKEIPITSTGDLDALARDFGGIIGYAEVLVTGRGRATKLDKPMGNKYFLKTKALCIDKSKKKVPRSIYVNNVPEGNIPFISSMMDADFSDLRGLIPGIMSNLNALNPEYIYDSFKLATEPLCTNIKMQTIDINNNIGYESHNVLDLDLEYMDPCIFIDEDDPTSTENRVNPITNMKCRESFQNINIDKSNVAFNAHVMPSNIDVQIYYISLSILFLYMILKLCHKYK